MQTLDLLIMGIQIHSFIYIGRLLYFWELLPSVKKIRDISVGAASIFFINNVFVLDVWPVAVISHNVFPSIDLLTPPGLDSCVLNVKHS